MTYTPIIGLEVHVELATKSKMFCGCPADWFGHEPNTLTCPVCLGLPGALPVPNEKAVEWTILLGLALGCTVNHESKFDRKNYFYPDLPKGYQISQYDQPISHSGSLTLHHPDKNGKVIRIRRVHIEEDTGKLIHAKVGDQMAALVDFNRSGVPLVEIVTEPDFRSLDQVDYYVKKLQQIIRYVGISGADMEKGTMRLEPSISLATVEQVKKNELPPYRVELKNINSFRFAKKALEYEIKRQTELLQKGQRVVQQTRGWSEINQVTVPQREKEEANDYRYFPEPDIPPMQFDKAQISTIARLIPELPDAKKERCMKLYGLSDYDAELLTETRVRADYFEEAAKHHQAPAKTIANWIINKKVNIDATPPLALVAEIINGTRVTELPASQLDALLESVIKENQGAVTDYKSGKTQAMMFLVGQAMRKLKGKASADVLQKRLVELTS